MRNAGNSERGEAYFLPSTIEELTKRLHYERLDDQVQGSLADIRALSPDGDIERGKWLDSAIDKMLYEVKAKSLQSDTYRVSVNLYKPSDPRSSFSFKFERLDGREDVSIMRHGFSNLNIEETKEFSENERSRHLDFSGHIESEYEALFAVRIKMVCETAVLCGRGDIEDYGRCGRHRSTEYLELPAFKRSVPFFISTDLEIPTKYGVNTKSNCRVMSLDGLKRRKKFERVQYPE